jgi:hypothetical protein
MMMAYRVDRAVPEDLQRRFDEWHAEGRPPQKAFSWEKQNWEKYVERRDILETLPNPIDRGGVLEQFERIENCESALDAYIASYLWGYARANFGPYRAERGIRLNTDAENGKDFAGELYTLARIAMTEGGVAAFQHVVDKRHGSRDFFAQWGPAFGTKFISFATKVSDQVATTPIMDSIVVGWFRKHCPEVGPLWLTWNSASSYRRYSECVAEWAAELAIEPEQVERLIFAKRRVFDTSFDYKTDTLSKDRHDPDKDSQRLRADHELLWTKDLSSGVRFAPGVSLARWNEYLIFTDATGVRHCYGSDAITSSYTTWSKPKA